MASSNKSEELVKPCLSRPDSQINGGNKKRLVFKFSLHRNPPTSSGQLENQATIASSTSKAYEESAKEDGLNDVSRNRASSSAYIVHKEQSESHERQLEDNGKAVEANNEAADNMVSWEKFETGTSNGTVLGDLMPMNLHDDRINGCLQFDNNSEVFNRQFGTEETDLSTSHLHGSSSLIIDAKHTSEPLNTPRKKLTIIKIKSKKVPEDSPSRFQGKTHSDGSAGAAVESTSKTVEEEPGLGALMADDCSDEPNYSPDPHTNGNGFYDSNINVSSHYEDVEDESPDLATDSARRARSLRLKASHTLETGSDYLQPGTSRSAERSSNKISLRFPSKHAGRSRSSINKREGYYRGDVSSSIARNKPHMPKKANWLLLSEQEEGYRYIPQLGDEVVYLRQVYELNIY